MFVLEGARSVQDAFDMWQKGNLKSSPALLHKRLLEKYSDYIDQNWF